MDDKERALWRLTGDAIIKQDGEEPTMQRLLKAGTIVSVGDPAPPVAGMDDKEQAEREAFEAWGRAYGFPRLDRHPTSPRTNYTERDVTFAWQGWLASSSHREAEVKA